MKRMKISDRAVNFILTRENEELRELTESKVAQSIGVNRSYLSHSFKNDQNITLSKFVKREKIHRALFILEKNHDKPIREIARELGFLKLKNFVLEFKKHVAIEPEKYRDLRKLANNN